MELLSYTAVLFHIDSKRKKSFNCHKETQNTSKGLTKNNMTTVHTRHQQIAYLLQNSEIKIDRKILRSKFNCISCLQILCGCQTVQSRQSYQRPWADHSTLPLTCELLFYDGGSGTLFVLGCQLRLTDSVWEE